MPTLTAAACSRALLVCVSLSFAVGRIDAAQAPAVDRLAWLEGCWQQDRGTAVVEEHWMKPFGGSLIGMGRTVAGGKTVEYEFLRIAEVGGVLAYIAQPSGQAEATFPVKALADGQVVFENPSHDFPQRVIYRRNADGSVTARVEGTLNGRARGQDFPYRRCGS